MFKCLKHLNRMGENLIMFLIILLLINTCFSIPLLPIITAIAGSGANLLNVEIDSLGIAKWITDSSKLSKILKI